MKIVALAGGVGGAKLAHGFAQSLPSKDLTIIVNTGDDFEHFGLYISPDLDTVCYTLAGLANPTTGWGRRDESWKTMENIQLLGGPDWFRLGDLDLGVHLERTRRLKAGQTLSQITLHFCRKWGVLQTVFPMSDQPVRTMVNTVEAGELGFQEYFVRERCQPQVKGFRFEGLDQAAPAPGLLEAIHQADFVIICPSNPWVSIDPILKLPGILDAVGKKKVIAVSPIIAGEAIKGPAAKMYAELGIQPSALAVARHYQRLRPALVIDQKDAGLSDDVNKLGLETFITNTIMSDHTERKRLAEDMLHFIGSNLL
ncbi:MAG: 2-phospho-L-lactate transferase [Anaerolineales bacterium]|nr:2-phospho-L-lactate transferase [Anaerolineales bacterium]